MSSSQPLLRLGSCLTFLILALAFSTQAQAGQLLTNGSFEQDAGGWSGVGFSTSVCPAYDGSAAAALTTNTSTNLQMAKLRQDISPISGGTYTLSGQARLLSGSTSVSVSLAWLDADGNQIIATTKNVSLSAAYAAFSVVEPAPPAETQAVSVRINSTSGGNSVVCLDALSLDGPTYVPPTETATSTPTPSVAASATATSAALTATPLPSATPQLASPTRTATVLPSATTSTAPTTSAPAAGLSFSNGGFESGLSGWQKFGGEFRAVSSPHRSGSAAGALTSTTDSTKWAYQAVAIDSSSAYRFSGYVSGEGSLISAYLRISWYASGDGSGQALATDDSTGQVDGAGTDFVYLSTNAVTPPQGAHSARLRVVMTPAGSASATVYMDDFDFSPATVSAQATPRIEPTLAPSTSAQGIEPAAPTPPSDAAAPSTSAATTQTPDTKASVTASPASSPDITPSAVSEVLEARVLPTRSSLSPSAPDASAQRSPSHSSLPVWPAAIVLGLTGAGGAYIYTRRKQS